MSPSIRTSNLQNFLRSMTPIVPSKTLSQDDGVHEELNKKNGKIEETYPSEYFTLGDLWKSFDEWSAYGVGTPVILENRRIVMQYYVPFLSQKGEALEFESSSTDGLTTESSDKLSSRSLSDNSIKTSSDGISASAAAAADSTTETSLLGDLCFQYQELLSPYRRLPFIEKILELARVYPALLTLKSVDLSPASWMSICWHPIYHIPAKGNVKDLGASFLTYHTLSSSYQDSLLENDKNGGKENICCENKSENGIYLHPFGLATFRMQGDVWINQGKNDHEILIDLHSAADSWLKQLNFDHHDFNFFNIHSNHDQVAL
ncbi:hypothetical protein M9H77_06201 [Catharanthus roseus]|uniref:Uncharacterized protein n=1 Tax=Catharanthus roseus TaxID=4058 RepID=A0ACC0BRM3_CATRO|nr:hypothetical protein M9H77_06201 [Catharanthus roseus]